MNIDGIKLLHGDCRELITAMPGNSVDSIVTDPPYELGFMGKSWDSTGVAYDVDLWRECLRVLKPGGHLLAFGGSRTYHRLAVAIEVAGFEIRDQIMWVYGSGFPKSMSLSKTIDKTLGAPVKVGTAFKVAGKYGNRNLRNPNAERDNHHHEPITDEAKQWAGWGTALKPAHEPIVMARKPVAEKTVAENVLRHGTGAINIDGCRVEGEPVPINKLENWSGFGQDIRPKYTQEINTDGRFPANFIHDGSEEVLDLMADAARFFYCAKTNKTERNAGGANHHPTVKPIALMRYLIRMVTPPNGTVLDPFAGSGTTLAAAIMEGCNSIGCELTAEYLPIIEGRVQWAHEQTESTLFK